MKEVLLGFLFQLAQGVLLILLPALATMIAGWVLAKAKIAWLNFKEAQSGWASTLESIATLAVKAAEQLNVAELIEDKKSYAVQVAQLWLNDKGLKIDLAVIEAAIEAAVFDEFNKVE